MRRIFDQSTAWIANRPSLAFLVIVFISILASIGLVRPQLLSQYWKEPPQSATPAPSTTVSAINERPASYRRVPTMRMGGDAILVVESEQFFSQRGLDAMRHVIRELESLDYVTRVTWMDSIPSMNLFGLAEPLFPKAPASTERFERAKQRALAHPFIRGQLLSADTRTALMLVDFDFLMIPSDDACISGLREVATAAAAEFPDVAMTFSVTGRVPIVVTSVRGQDSDRLKYQLIAYGIILGLSVVLFRGISAVVIVAIAAALGVFWTVGLVGFFEIDFNPLVNVILPVLVSLVGFTDGVHLMATIRKIRANGATSHQAAVEGIRQVGLACALTSLTTAIGLGSLLLAHHEMVRDFGMCSVIGVTATFVAVITWIPVACSTRLGSRLHIGLEHSLIERNLSRIGGIIEMVLARRVWFASGGVILLVIMSAICAQLRPDERQTTTLPKSSEPALAMAQVDRAMGGLETSLVRVIWEDSIDVQAAGEVISQVDQILNREPLIGHPLSIMTIAAALSGEGNTKCQMAMIDLLPPQLKRTFYSPEEHRATITFRVQDLGIKTYGPVFERIEQQLLELQQRRPGFTLELAGTAVWRWRNLYQIVIDLLASLGSAAIIIFVVLGVTYRSVRVGLISIVPNLFPLAVAGVYLVWAGESLEIVTVCAFTVCLGIAVDDTIHFLTRFFEERENTDSDDEAIRRAFTGVGTALIITTIVLVAGFSSVFFSDARDHILFASMGTITITAALIADLLILPAMLSLFLKQPAKRNKSSNR